MSELKRHLRFSEIGLRLKDERGSGLTTNVVLVFGEICREENFARHPTPLVQGLPFPYRSAIRNRLHNSMDGVSGVGVTSPVAHHLKAMPERYFPLH